MVYAYRGVASALDTLLAQLNALAPKRSKLSDGALGDQAHAVRLSFHNPNSAGIVQARDFTHDPAGGLDCNWLASALIASGDKRIYEIIWNRRYWTPSGGWVPYYGTNPHDKHLHLTVRSDPRLYNSTAPWDLSGPGGTPSDEEFTVAQFDEIMAKLEQIRTEAWQQHKDMAGFNGTIVGNVARILVGNHTDGNDRLTDLWNAIRAIAPAGVDVDALKAAMSDVGPVDVDALVTKFADEADRRARDGDPATGPTS